MRSFAIDSRRDLSSARSGEPGAYDFTGSFTGVGTRRTPVKADLSPMGAEVVEAPGDTEAALASGAWCLDGAAVERAEGLVGADMALVLGWYKDTPDQRGE